MTMSSDTAQGALLSPDDSAKFQAKLIALLAKQTRRYTRGESSSVPEKTARRLLESLCFCLGISAQKPDGRWAKLFGSDLNEELKRGQQVIAQKTEYAKRNWQSICANMPPLENESMYSTLKSIGGCWKKYDIRFFAAEISCDIDYQLAIPVPEELISIDYINEYLRRLKIENAFLRLFGADEMIPVLNKYCGDYKGLLINLFEPVFSNALALRLLGRTGDTLLLERSDTEKICEIIENMQRSDIERLLLNAAAAFPSKALPESAAGYFAEYCRELAARMDSLRDCGGMSGIFQTV